MIAAALRLARSPSRTLTLPVSCFLQRQQCAMDPGAEGTGTHSPVSYPRAEHGKLASRAAHAPRLPRCVPMPLMTSSRCAEVSPRHRCSLGHGGGSATAQTDCAADIGGEPMMSAVSQRLLRGLVRAPTTPLVAPQSASKLPMTWPRDCQPQRQTWSGRRRRHVSPVAVVD